MMDIISQFTLMADIRGTRAGALCLITVLHPKTRRSLNVVLQEGFHTVRATECNSLTSTRMFSL